MKKFLACAAAIVALAVLPVDRSAAYPGGGGHGSGGGGGHSSGGSGHSSGGHIGGNTGGTSHANSVHPNTTGPTNSNTFHSNTSTHHQSNTGGHPNNTSAHNHSNTSHSNAHNNSKANGGHYHYTHTKGGKWDSKEWNHAWYRHRWYHSHFIWWNSGWWWWDPDVSDYVPYVEGQYIPEDYYAQGDEPPAGGGAAIRIVNPPDNDTTINYSINDNDYQIAPGSEQDLPADQQWVISFDRGENDGNAEYTLTSGVYTFGTSDHGWELYHTSEAVTD